MEKVQNPVILCKSIHFKYYFGDGLTILTDYVNDHGVMLDSTLHLQRRVYCIYFSALKLLGHIRFRADDFSSPEGKFYTRTLS
jgi:hypothetical protein